MSRRIAVIGYGAVGRETTALLAARGDEIRVVQRRAPGSTLPASCTFVAADLEDAPSVARACQGVDTVVCCAGLPYDSRVWERVWPKAMTNLLDGCAASGARFVFADNLYMYGPCAGPLTETTPLSDYGRKPRLRAQITRQWQEAHAAGRVRCVAARASDFYGPDVPTSVISVFGVARLAAGKAALIPYPADFPHDFTYVPDFARALVTLIDAADEDYGQAWHVPNAPRRSLRDVLVLAAARMGVPLRLVVLPGCVAWALGLFNRELAELQEMRFQTDRPYVVDASKFASRFWGDATPLETGLDATIAFYRNAK